MAFCFNDLCSNLLPVGRVKAQVTDIKFKVTATGEASNDILVTFTIVEGPAAKRVHAETLYEKANSFRLKPFLTACKVDMNREFATKEELYQFGLKEAKNKIIMIDIGKKAYNGKEYNEIKDFLPIPDSKTTASEVLEDFNVGEAKSEAVVNVVDDPIPESFNVSDTEVPTLDITSDDNPF